MAIEQLVLVDDETDYLNTTAVTYELTFDRYIANPYWPEVAEIIDIEKSSGTNRARSEGNKEKALSAFLDAKKMTVDEFAALKARAQRQFYTNEDADIPNLDHPLDEIIIPAKQILSCFAQCADTAPSAIRVCKPEQVRSFIDVKDIFTGKKTRDGTFTRVVPVKNGTGALLSNQRGLRENDYIANFSADLVMNVAAEINLERLANFVKYAGKFIGVGASRKMNYGRFRIA